jgi:hypothetical protein
MKVCDIDPPDLGRVDPVDKKDDYDWDTETEKGRNSSLTLHQYFKRKKKRNNVKVSDPLFAPHPPSD